MSTWLQVLLGFLGVIALGLIVLWRYFVRIEALKAELAAITSRHPCEATYPNHLALGGLVLTGMRCQLLSGHAVKHSIKGTTLTGGSFKLGWGP